MTHQNFYVGDRVQHNGQTAFIQALRPDGVVALVYDFSQITAPIDGGAPAKEVFIPCTTLRDKKMEWVLVIWKNGTVMREYEMDETKARSLKLAHEKAGATVKFFQREVLE
jgi:hypothetical protein